MKKSSIILFAVALFISFTACNGSKKSDQATEEKVEEVKQEEVVVPQEAYVELTPEEALKAFNEFTKEYADAFNNLARNPSKFQKMAGEVQQKVADMERLKVDFSAKQLKEYEKARDIISQVNSGGKK